MGKNDKIKIGDFGLSRYTDSNTLTPKLGTNGYKSPEMEAGSFYKYKTDVWSAGCVLFELIFLKHLREIIQIKESFEIKMPSKLIKLIKMFKYKCFTEL